MQRMARYCYVVFSNPVAGKEAEYNRWYTEVHLRDVLAVPGFVAAQRFRLADDSAAGAHRYLALYEIETDDVQKTLADLGSRAGTPAMLISEALDVSGVSATHFVAITERVVAKL